MTLSSRTLFSPVTANMRCLTIFCVIFCCGGAVLAGDLCPPAEFYDDRTDSCRRCKVCAERAFEMAPCLEYADTLCVDLNQIFKKQSLNSKWHEMEGSEDARVQEKVVVEEQVKSNLRHLENLWGQLMLVALCLSFLTVVGVVILLALRYYKKIGRNQCRKGVGRGRLFSRDRLNTTEFMNNLATLDRRLAIDEILLEKRKRAIFEPQLLHEPDEVFVDLSGLPRGLRDDHEYEEVDHKKCLLQMKDQQ